MSLKTYRVEGMIEIYLSADFELEDENYFEVGRVAKVKLLEEANELLGGVDFLDEQVKIIDIFEEN